MTVQITKHTTVFRVVPERVSATQAFGGTGTFVFTERRDALEYHDVNSGKILTATLAPTHRNGLTTLLLSFFTPAHGATAIPLSLATTAAASFTLPGLSFMSVIPRCSRGLVGWCGRQGNKERPMTLLPPRMQIVWQVLEAARDVGDNVVVSACARLIGADRRGWRKHHDPEDWKVVKAFAPD